MKKLLTIITAIFISINLFAQAPQKMSYQAVIRNASNNLITNAPVKMRISILQGGVTGTVVYSELHSATTNANGLVTIEIGEGTSPTGTFSSINWGSGTYFLKTETDPNNGSTYSIVGTSQLLSVPYALEAKNSETANSAEIAKKADTSTFALKANSADTAKFAVNSKNAETAIKADSSNFALQSGNGFNRLSGDTLFFDNGKNLVIPGIGIANTSSGITLHSCDATNVHNTSVPYGTMTDQEGNVYRTVKIGTQIWMAENLKTSIYRSGVVIPNIFNNTSWGRATFGALCSYENNTANDCPYGKLYNWFAVNDINLLCPMGWHVPSVTEWDRLADFLGSESLAGGRMKSTGTQYWLVPNTFATNSSGFSALPGGLRNGSGTFSAIKATAQWWASPPAGSSTANYRALEFGSGSLNIPPIGTINKVLGLSVRCVKD